MEAAKSYLNELLLAARPAEIVTDLERDLGRRWFEEVWNKGRREAIAEMLAPRAVIHTAESAWPEPKASHPFYDYVRAALSEWRSRILLCRAMRSAYAGRVLGSIPAMDWALPRLARRSISQACRHRHVDPSSGKWQVGGRLAELGHAWTDRADHRAPYSRSATYIA